MSKAEEKLQQAIVGVCLNPKACFWSVLIYRLKLISDETQPGSYTDGTYMGYNSDFIVNQLSVPQVETLLAHEVTHIAQGHLWRMEHRDQQIWNEACDHSLNNMLEEAGFAPIPGWLCDPRFKGMSEEQVYEILLKEKLNGQQPQNQQGQGKGQGSGKNASHSNSGAGNGKPEAGRPEAWQIGAVREPASKEHVPSLKADWEVATLQAAQAAKAMGYLPGFAKRLVEEIRKPKVDWKSVLRRWVQELAKADYSWKRPSARYIPSGLYLPSLRSEQMPPIVIGVDTSGSIDQVTLDKFAGEMQSIIDECKPERTIVIYCDADIAKRNDGSDAIDIFEQGDILQMNPFGGGGTKAKPVFDRVVKDCIEPACLIYLTDMAIFDFNKLELPEYPVLWASITENRDAPFGEVIFIGGE